MEPPEQSRIARRLAAILAADVAGYSRLMGADEEGTRERLKALRNEVLDPKIAEHHGRIVKTTGDGLLVEFAGVVDAVRCAVAVQQAMPEQDRGIVPDRRIAMRIGINLGDIIKDRGDIYGDGVGVAARPEALTRAGRPLGREPAFAHPLADHQCAAARDARAARRAPRQLRHMALPARSDRRLCRALSQCATCFRLGDRGLVVITSCGNGGIINTLKRPKREMPEKLVLGGTGSSFTFPA